MDLKYDYNDAYQYFKNKYGYIRQRLTCSTECKIRRKPKKQQKQMIATFTDRDYVLILNPATEEVDKQLELLMSQYYYGIAAKYDLNNLLIQILE